MIHELALSCRKLGVSWSRIRYDLNFIHILFYTNLTKVQVWSTLFEMKYLRNKLLVISLLMIATITPLCTIGTKKASHNSRLNLDTQNQNPIPWLTIWIHGTRLTPKIFFKKFFHVAPGLTKATKLDTSYHHRSIAQTLCELDNTQFDLNAFYLYGWSGKLSFNKRRIAAQELHESLNKLIAQYTIDHGVMPRLRIITHSHGGNVALNLAHCTTPNSQFSIDQLILLACPVQEQTKELVKHPLFKNIYSLYSKRDLLQVADPQGIYANESDEDFFDRSWFSQRLFPADPKLKQAQITYNGRGILHVEFLLCKKMAGVIGHLPEILNLLANSEQPHLEISLSGKD